MISPLIVMMDYHVFVGWEYLVNNEYCKEFLDAVCLAHPGEPLDFQAALDSGKKHMMKIEEKLLLENDLLDDDGYARIININEYHRGDKIKIMPLEPF